MDECCLRFLNVFETDEDYEFNLGYDQLKAQGKVTEDEYENVINELIEAVRIGKCRLPIAELIKRKRV